MKNELLALRRLLGIGLIWGAIWAVLAIVVGTAVGVLDPGQIDPGEEPIALAPVIGLAGFGCGFVFASILALVQRQKSAVELPLIGTATWGILVSAAFPVLMGKGVPEMLVTIPVGAVSAMASVVIAQRWLTLRGRGAA